MHQQSNPVIGIDGCKAGWTAVWMDRDQIDIRIFNDIQEVFQQYPKTMTFIDIPIGLSGNGIHRSIETEMRYMLKRRSASVFTPPCRAAVYSDDYESAKQIHYSETGKSISIQSYNISRKIREVDSFLRWYVDYRYRFYEAHPEIVFQQLNRGKPLIHSKKTMDGQFERMAIIRRFSPEMVDAVNTSMDVVKINQANAADLIDAAGLAVAAALTADFPMRTLTQIPERDYYGLPFRIAYTEVTA